MLSFSEKLYSGPGVNAESMKRRLKRSEQIEGLYILTRGSGKGSQVEIVNSLFLRQPYLRDILPEIIGFASTRKDAFRLVQTMTEEAIRKTGRPELSALFEKA